MAGQNQLWRQRLQLEITRDLSRPPSSHRPSNGQYNYRDNGRRDKGEVMHRFLRIAAAIALISGSASFAAAGNLTLTLSNGRVTLMAQDVPLRQILDEWSRVGKTTIVNGDKLTGPPLTLQLVDRPEREVLDLLLRSASGYIAAQRAASIPDASMFDRVMILPVSRGPVGVAANTPTPFNSRPVTMQQMPMPMPDDDNPNVEQPQVYPPGVATAPVPGPMPPTVPGAMQVPPGGQAPPLTAPRPGMLPAPPAGQPNPYGPPIVPGGSVVPSAPGTIPPPFVRPGGPGGPGGEPE